MTYTVSGGALNSTQSNPYQRSVPPNNDIALWWSIAVCNDSKGLKGVSGLNYELGQFTMSVL